MKMHSTFDLFCDNAQDILSLPTSWGGTVNVVWRWQQPSALPENHWNYKSMFLHLWQSVKLIIDILVIILFCEAYLPPDQMPLWDFESQIPVQGTEPCLKMSKSPIGWQRSPPSVCLCGLMTLSLTSSLSLDLSLYSYFLYLLEVSHFLVYWPLSPQSE